MRKIKADSIIDTSNSISCIFPSEGHVHCNQSFFYKKKITQQFLFTRL